MKRFHLLVATDGTPASNSAVLVAGRLAVSLKAALAVLYVNHAASETGSPDQAANRILAPLGIEPRVEVRGGDPADEILSAARGFETDLVVVGSRGRSNVAGALLGSVSQRVAAHAGCPVLLDRSDAETVVPPRTIMLAIEGSEGLAPLLEITSRIAAAVDARVAVVHVSPPGADSVERALYHAELTHGEEAVAEAIAALERRGISARALPRARGVNVARVISRCADAVGADLIVMGAHPPRRSSEDAGVGRSVAVTHITRRPVLVTPEAPAAG